MGDFISLIKISPENNNNRYYRMINKGSGCGRLLWMQNLKKAT